MATPQVLETAGEATTIEALADRILTASVGALEMFGVYLGRRLGLYRALTAGGAQTSGELARRAGITERYAREWLEQQAVAGFVALDDTTRCATERRYRLPAAHAVVLLDEEHPAHVAPIAEMLVGTACALPDVLDAYRTGAGVPYERYGADFRHGQGALNRPLFARELTGSWLPALPDLHERLAAEPPARVADVGCGVGFSTIALARAYPRALVTGYDFDPGSIADASAHAADAGVTVSFARRDAAAVAEDGPFDLVVVVQALHDMARPGDVLAALRRALAVGGSILLAEPRAADQFAAPGELAERLFYGFSTIHCLPAACADGSSHATGTCLRPDVVRDLAVRAGLARCEVLPIEHPLLRLYRLRS